jgi:hypothetical protein
VGRQRTNVFMTLNTTPSLRALVIVNRKGSQRPDYVKFKANIRRVISGLSKVPNGRGIKVNLWIDKGRHVPN